MKKLLIVAPVALLLAACGGAVMPTVAPTTTLLPTMASPGPTQATEAIACLPEERSGNVSASIVDFAFEPSNISASVGQTVAWTNTGQAPHTVTFNDGPDCGRANSGGTIVAQFHEAGEYAYVCTIHPSMRATVTVSP